MPTRSSSPGLPALALSAWALLAAPALVRADGPARILASDDRGVTLRLDVPAARLGAPAADGTRELVVPGFQATDVPGRPGMPFVSVLLALPPGARATARVEQEAAWEVFGTAPLAIAGQPGFQGEQGLGLVPVRTAVTAIADGPWPKSEVEVGEPFSLRRQRMVAVLLRPFRWDAATGRITTTRSLTVRVDFSGGATSAGATGMVEEDPHWDPVLREALLNFDQARGWRSRPLRTARRAAATLLEPRLAGTAGRAAFDESYPEVRVHLDTTGVYDLPFTELATKGYPAGIPISQVSVHRHEFVEGANPPYVTIELPIEVNDGNGNGVFDDEDHILVWAQSWAERSRASWAQRSWGDGEVIYATAVTGAGLRVPTRPGWRNVPALTPISSFRYTQHWEKNLTYFLFPPDTLADQFHWTEIELYYDRPDTFHFETNSLDTTHAVSVSVSWMGRKLGGTHYSWAQYRKAGGPFITVADSLAWFGTSPRTVTVTYPASTLGEGNVNTLRVWGKGQNAPPDPSLLGNNSDNVGLNWIEASYWRRYRALNEALSCNSADASGELQISATGFSYASIEIYDVSDSLAPVRLDLDPSHITIGSGEFQIEFQDSVAAGAPHQYLLFSAGRSVPSSRYGQVVRQQITNRTQGDYLMVVPEEFEPAVAPLKALRESQQLSVVEASFESLCDEFNGGRHSSYAIKRFARYAYDNWNAKFLLLVGDGSEDPQNFLAQSSPDRIPVQKISGPVVIQFGYEIIPSDPWYACMENCDLGNFSPVLQDLFIGRLPVQSLQQTADVVAKLVKYEDLSGDQSWRSKMLLCDDDAYSAETFFGGPGGPQIGYCLRLGEHVFRAIDETIEDVIRNGAGLSQAVLDTFHLDTKLLTAGCPVGGGDCTCKDQAITQQYCHGTITPQLITKLNSGRFWWNYQGHANEFVLAHEDLYVNRDVNDDKDLLMNDDMPYLFSAFSCHANAFARFADQATGRGPALGEEMVTLPKRGSIASWASTGYEILPFSGTSHINVAWARAMFESPPHDEFKGDKGARAVLGETIALALARYVPTVAFNPNERGIGLTYHLLGDPGTRLSIGSPETAVLANSLPVVSGTPVRLHTVGDTLRLVGDLASNVALTDLALDRSDAAGTVTVPATDYTITPTFPDTAASGSGGRRYQLSYFTTLAPETYHYTFRTTDRYGLSGSFDVVFQFLTQLLLDSAVLTEGDPVPPTGNLALRLFSPKPLDPATGLTLTVNGVSQPFTAAPVPGDASGREWTLSWTHAPYPIDQYEVRLTVVGGGIHNHHFRVVVGGGELQVENPMAFPNPFDETGTAFSFLLVSGSSVDLQIRVFTTSGRLIYERVERGLAPGYHQLHWDGRDAEGDKLANGVYVYRLLATNGPSKAEYLGRLVKLRKPRRAAETP